MKKFFGNAVASVYFIAFILPSALILGILQIELLMDINSIMKSGFSQYNYGLTFLGLFGLMFGISMLVPALRKIYKKMPWLYVYIQIFMVNTLILTAGIYLLNIGFEVQNPARHTIFLCLMIASLIIGRLAMCFYYRLKPIKIVRE